MELLKRVSDGRRLLQNQGMNETMYKTLCSLACLLSHVSDLIESFIDRLIKPIVAVIRDSAKSFIHVTIINSLACASDKIMHRGNRCTDLRVHHPWKGLSDIEMASLSARVL